MKSNALFLTKNIQLLKRLGIILLMMSLSRLVFYFVNSDAFTDVRFYDFLVGVWMDAITVGMYAIPFYALSLLPFPIYHEKWYQITLKTVFHITNSIIIVLNLIDVEYFKFTAKRSTADLFSMVSTGNDINQLFVTFMIDFW